MNDPMNIDDVRAIVGDRIVRITPENVAEMFAHMGSDEQARFFNHIDVVTSEWKLSLDHQLAFVNGEESLTDKGRAIMRLIGDYASK